MIDFITINENVEFVLTEKKSKFIANLIKISCQEEAEEIIKKYKKQYHDARHNCIAYRVMENDQIIEKSSDDGEPSGTAGAPMLNILQKNNLCNILIIVTRYFGGILLGTGGLVRAYSDALNGAIEASNKVIQTMGYIIECSVEYSQFEKFQYYCKTNKIEIVNANYLDNIVCKISIEESKKEHFLKDINEKNINIIDYKIFDKTLITVNKFF
ncbi:MAG: YigZ family protein [Clostridia bacterium]|nr:YigZ family protein [Clostridia bacterium]